MEVVFIVTSAHTKYRRGAGFFLQSILLIVVYGGKSGRGGDEVCMRTFPEEIRWQSVGC
jgi:hypothetical protein